MTNTPHYEPPALDVEHQEQEYPGRERDLSPTPMDTMEDYVGSGLLAGHNALITGGDSGIGRAVAIAFAKEGANVVIGYLDSAEDEDAAETIRRVEEQSVIGAAVRGDLGTPASAATLVDAAVEKMGALDVLVCNHAFQNSTSGLEEISDEQMERTFQVNALGTMRVIREALPHLQSGSSIIITSSVTGLRGSAQLIDYAATKGALIALTYSLATSLLDRGIRVNCVAPGPVWTPLIPATAADKVEGFGNDVPMGRPAHPDEIAPSYVFLAAPRMSSYYSGEVLAPIGGQPLPG
jgi:NAD(P)-dependent dehydrogenase (short-subunit alcohol dehydrogenase family)